MTEGLTPYPQYKDSEIGPVPAHWAVRRLKRVCRFAYGDALRTETRQGGNVSVYGSNGAVGLHSSANTRAPCIVIGRKGSFGKVNFSANPVFAIDTTFFVDDRWTTAEIRWLFYLLRWLRLDQISKDSAIPGLDREDAYSRLVPVPTSSEQRAIVQFLDRMDRRIGGYVGSKKKLIALLTEQRQAIMLRAVTRGLHPSVGLKPSGVEWLGHIPDKWEIVPLKFLASRIQNGATPPSSGRDFYAGGTVPWYGPSSIRHYEEVGPPVRHLNAAAFTAGRARLIRAPAVLVVVIGATAGRTALLMEDGSTNQQITSFEIRQQRVLPHFVLHQLRGAATWLRSTASTATIPLIDVGRLSRLPIAVPPLHEQRAILRETQERVRELDSALKTAGREIDLIAEFRTRLITDVVTGKLDVQEVAAHLSAESTEAEPLDAIEDEGVTDFLDTPDAASDETAA